jgi:hypothetical protein
MGAVGVLELIIVIDFLSFIWPCAWISGFGVTIHIADRFSNWRRMNPPPFS